MSSLAGCWNPATRVGMLEDMARVGMLDDDVNDEPKLLNSDPSGSMTGSVTTLYSKESCTELWYIKIIFLKKKII